MTRHLVRCDRCGHIHTPSGCTGGPTASDIWAGVSVSACDCMELCSGCGTTYDATDPDVAGTCVHDTLCRRCWLACDRGRSCRDGCHERGER